MRAIAVDWSGREVRAEETLWLAEVLGGRLVTLENGRGRDELVAHLVTTTGPGSRTVVGIDFAFSFPKWWCDQQGWHDPSEVWSAMADHGERVLADCAPPFWGRPGRPNPVAVERRLRVTDTRGAKSVFQIGGSGAVGTGSIRGMPHLLTLAEHGFGFWPFGPVRWPLVVEIYPRALTGPVIKSRWASRHAFLFEHFPAQPAAMLERAAGSEDAFDAAVSALVMAEHADQLAALRATTDPVVAIEGQIWRPAS
jgi:hypothetical protein